MERHVVLVVLSAIAFCTAPTIAAAAEVLRRPPPEAVYESPTAAAHEVVLKVHRGWGAPGEDRVMRTRDGIWLREDTLEAGNRRTVFSNFATATSFTVTRDEMGDYNNLAVTRFALTDEYHRYTRSRTGDGDLVLGEKCDVWSMVRAGEKEGPRHLNCITDDGITLWSRVYYRSGKIMRSEQAVSFKRRRAQIHVQPPRELFKWSYWERRCGETRSAHQQGDFEVTLTGSLFATKHAQVIRRHRQRSLVDTNGANGSRELKIDCGNLSLRYEAGSRTAPLSLRVSVFKFDGARTAPVPLDRPAASAAGEACAWFDVWPGVADAGREECRTSDGIPLQIVRIMRGRPSLILVATSVNRKPMTQESVTPPQDVFEWGQ